MVLILGQTPNFVSPAYIPVFFNAYEWLPADAATPPAIEFFVTINGEQTLPIHQSPSQFGETNSGDLLYLYQIDISEILQTWFDNPKTIRPIASGLPTSEFDWVAEFNISIKSFVPDENGVLIPEDSVTESQTMFAINARLFHSEFQNLQDETVFTVRDFLTTKPDAVSVCRDDSEYLYIYSSFPSVYWRFRAYNTAGDLISEGITETVPDAENTIQSMGVAPANVANISWASGGVDLSDSNIRYYTVEAGTPLSSFFAVTRPRKYFLNNSCCPAYRVHFLNKFGTFDSVSIGGDRSESYAVKSDDFESTMPLFTLQNISSGFGASRTSNRLTASSTQSIRAESYGLKTAESVWLRQLLESTDVFIEQGDTYTPVIVKDGANTLKTSGEPFNDFNITFELNREQSQRK